MGRHSKLRHRTPQMMRKGMIEMVDVRTGQNHLLATDAAAAGLRAPHRYLALCGANVLLAAMTDPGTGYCWSCRSSAFQPPHRTVKTRLRRGS